MRLLITGGAGFIGSHIAERALAAGFEVAVLDNLSTGHRRNLPSGVRFFPIDLRDRNDVFSAVQEFRPAAISHQAAQASVSVSVREPALDAETNILGTLNLLDAARAALVETFVFASTGGAIYGEVPEGAAATEETPPDPRSPYAIAKYAAERYIGFFREQHGMKTVILRYANVYGPRQDPHGEAGVVAIFASRILNGEEVRINARVKTGDHGCVRDYTCVDDVAQANLAALTRRIDVPVLNVGTGVATTTQQLAEAMQQTAGQTTPLSFRPPRPGDLERSVLDAARFRRLIGEPTPLAAGLQQTIDWFRRTRSAS